MGDENDAMSLIGPVLLTTACVAVGAAGAIASDAQASGPVSTADDGANETAGRYDDLSPDYS